MKNYSLCDKNFDRHFTSVEKTIKRTWTAIIVVWVLGALISLTVLAGLIVVAVHFAAKYW